MRCLNLLYALALLSATASAQSFNLDVGPNLFSLAPTPSDGYAAAGGQSGHWDPVDPNLLPLQLKDINDALTNVFADSDVHSWYSHYPLPNLPQDDNNLLTDSQSISWMPGTIATWTFTGLQDGSYTLYTYAYDVSFNGATTTIRIPAMPGSDQVVGGYWTTGHQLGVTFAMHQVTVTGGTLVLEAESMNGQHGLVCGFQFVTASPFSAYCFGDPGAISCPCGNNNDGTVPGSGCANGVFTSGARLTGAGTPSVTGDTVVLFATNTEPSQSGLYFQANDQISVTPFWDGIQCAGGGLRRLGVRFADAGGASNTSGWTTPISQIAGNISAGDTKHYQGWYRNPTASPCATDANTTNGISITWEP